MERCKHCGLFTIHKKSHVNIGLNDVKFEYVLVWYLTCTVCDSTNYLHVQCLKCEDSEKYPVELKRRLIH